ncbi:MAG: hypothetical protein QM784_07420 [Polyangiaceae bacterium]
MPALACLLLRGQSMVRLLRCFTSFLILCSLPLPAQGAADETSTSAAATETDTASKSPKATETGTASKSEVAPTTLHWYGWQNLAVVLPSTTALVLARTDGDDHTLGWLMFPGYAGALFGSPIVHLAHGQFAKSFISASWSLTSIVVFGRYVPHTCDLDPDAPPESHVCAMSSKYVIPPGVLIGALVAVGLDAALLSWETVPKRHVAMTPYFTFGDRGVLAGIQGTL